MKIPVSIISGYLGAGKTTLLRRIIENLDRKFAILMNEFGEVSIDSQIIKGKNVDVQELSGGCVCCSLTGEFEFAIREIIQKYNPEIIIIETTGVAEPDAIVFDVEESLPEVKLDSVTIVVDADSMLRFTEIGRIGQAQIGVADIVLLNKIDLVGKGSLEGIENRIKGINQRAPIFRTKYCEVDVALLFGLGVEHVFGKKADKNGVAGADKTVLHPSGQRFQSFVLDVKHKSFTKEMLEKFLKGLPEEVYRLKGFVDLEGKSTLVNFVAGRWDLEVMRGERRLVFIGEDIKKFEEQISENLNKDA